MDDFQPKRGDRYALTPKDMNILDMQILPTARRWAENGGSLAEHGRQTLAFWGEYDKA